VTGSGLLRDGCGSTTVRVTALIGQNISSRLHCGEGNWGQIHLSCFPGPESNGSSLRGMLLLPSGSGSSTLTHLPQSSHWAKVSVATVGSLLVDISIVAQVSLSEENTTPLPAAEYGGVRTLAYPGITLIPEGNGREDISMLIT
jgi:hypothetical protein